MPRKKLERLNVSLGERVEERTRERDRTWDLTRDLVLVCKPDGTLVALNPAWERNLGWVPSGAARFLAAGAGTSRRALHHRQRTQAAGHRRDHQRFVNASAIVTAAIAGFPGRRYRMPA